MRVIAASRSRLLVVFLLTAAMVMAMSGVALAQAAGVTPGEGPVGSEVNIFGSGFEPGEYVTVEFGGWTIASGYADDTGEFSLWGTIPEIPLGEHPMDINGESNYAELNFRYRSVAMMGISGGGWLTTLYAALDPRVRASYPVAGTLPIFLRSKAARDWGDYEQNHPDLYRIANYPELYVLGSHGEGRRQIQILNRYDDCCFAGTRSRLYEEAVREGYRFYSYGDAMLLL